MAGSDELAEELHSTRELLEGLTEAVQELARRTTRNWLYTIFLAFAVCVSFASAIFGWVNANEIDQDLRQFSEQLFLTSCVSQNASNAAIRQSNVQSAELLIKVTNADVEHPEAANSLRTGVASLNDSIKDRDCDLALDKANK